LLVNKRERNIATLLPKSPLYYSLFYNPAGAGERARARAEVRAADFFLSPRSQMKVNYLRNLLAHVGPFDDGARNEVTSNQSTYSSHKHFHQIIKCQVIVSRQKV
jgi:hypothetical protein